jgi:DNA-binding NarL/FixJ family response regulator
LTDLLGYKIVTEFKNKVKENQIELQNKFRLTSKQKRVLQLLAAGETEKAAAIEMGLNIGTIKYHKLNAFKKLGASCTTEAVIKAIKTSQISLEDINV